MTKEDHRPARVYLQWSAKMRLDEPINYKTRKCPPYFDSEALLHLCDTMSNACQVDVHTHFSQLQASLAACTRRSSQLVTSQPHRANMTRATWELVCAKRKWRANLARCQKLQHRTHLQAFFAAWKHSQAELDFQKELAAFDDLLHQLDVDIAEALFQFRQFGAEVVKALRADDVAFYNSLAQESSHWLGPSSTRRFWKVLRRSLPKFRQRRKGFDPLSIEALEEQWIPHFSQLEVGEQVSPDELLMNCHQRQVSAAPAQTAYCTTELPTLFQLEDVLRQTQPHKATGYDVLPSVLFHEHPCRLAELFFPLLLKMMTW